MRQGIFLPESTSSADSPGVQSHASVSVRTLKIPQLADMPLFGHMKILHTPIGMGSTALAAAVKSSQVKQLKFPTRDKEVPFFFFNQYLVRPLKGHYLAHLSAEISPKSHVVSTLCKNLLKVWVLRLESKLC